MLKSLRSFIPDTLTKSPSVLITEKALSDMVRAVLDHPSRETAWGLAGVYFDAGRTVIITNVIQADPDEITRQYATTQLGGDQQVEALRWLSGNEKQLREHRGITTTGTYGFLFKGHSHHQLGYEQYSGQDVTSIVSAVERDGMVVAIGPLANIEEHRYTVTPMAGGQRVVIRHEVEFRFYYFSKTMLDAGQRSPILVQPTVIKSTDVNVPVPELGWHLYERADFLTELRLLKAYGCDVRVIYRDTNGAPPLEIQMLVTHPGWRGSLSIVTAADYPATAPTFQVLNPEGLSIAGGRWTFDPTRLAEGPLWSRGETFLEVVFRLEKRGEL